MSTDENAQLEAAVKYLRKPYMDHPGWGAELEDLLRRTIVAENFLERPFSEEFTKEDKTELGRIFGEYDKQHAAIMKVMNEMYEEVARPYRELTKKYRNSFKVWNIELPS